MSKKYELDFEDFKKILRQIGIIYSPVILLFLRQIENWTFDGRVLIALAISTSIDIARRYFTNYTK